jgi:hypothetical protein
MSDELRKFCSNNFFDFTRGDGTYIGVLFLEAGGKIGMAVHPNESRWAAENDHLVFLNNKNEVVTRFDSFDPEAGTFQGPYLPQPHIMHVLKKLDISQMATGRRADPTKIRNIMYHVAPYRANDVWMRNIKELQPHMHIFNGRKLLSVVAGQDFHDVSAVLPYFPNFEVMTFENDPALRENISFLPMLRRMYSLNENEMTFYAHTKGVTRPDNFATVLWRNIMLYWTLDRIDLVEKALKDHSCAGCFKLWQVPLPDEAYQHWHFAGTYFWFNNKKLYSLIDWQSVTQSGWGAEAYVGKVFPFSEGFCLFGDNFMGCYSADRIRNELVPLLKKENPVKFQHW